MTDYEIYTYDAFRNRIHDDERVIERASMSLLDMDKVQSYLARMREERPGFSRLSTQQSYEMLGINTVFYAMKHYVQPLLMEGFCSHIRPRFGYDAAF